MRARELAEQLAARSDSSVKRDGAGGYLVACPAHRDAAPSLHIATGKRHGIVLHCHAGCTQSAVLAAAGLCWGDLFASAASSTQPVSAQYVYVDELGRELFAVARRGDGPGKRFATYQIDAHGELVPHARGVRRVLYRLPEVVAAVRAGRDVYLCEGEKDADALRAAYGVTATTNAFGALSWAKDCERYGYASHLAGARLVVVQDNDTSGRKRTAQILASLGDVVAELRLVAARYGKDAADHIAAGGRLGELVPIEAPALLDDGTFAALPHAMRTAITSGNLSHLEYRVLIEVACLSVRRADGEVSWQPVLCPSSWLAKCCGNASPSAVRSVLHRLEAASVLIAEDSSPGASSRGRALSYRVNGDYLTWRPLRHRDSKTRPSPRAHLSAARTAPHRCEDTNTREDLGVREEGEL